ncbi:MAG: prepilin-type N-terminal cleavage/methylation domain-containing protein [Gammaproteobacteria bacterium]|nr:prepilin-type N-terminal cleavage/methylation domain-containing protein [Gammaproteobacteria bacterium]
MNKSDGKGFTLIELLIAMTIVAIISAIAYPSYHNSIRVSRRVEAQQALMEAAQKLENYYAKNANYTTNLRQLGYPERAWNNVRSGSGAVHYRIRVNNPEGCGLVNCFVLESQSLGDQKNDAVSGYKLWSTGRKQVRVNAQDKEGW